jgi:UMF1 family MFS transporter
MTTPIAPPLVATGEYPVATGKALGKKGIGWAMFEWARNPYYNLIVIYVFAAYFAKYVVEDPVRGQALTGRVIFTAGIIMVPLAPVLGSIIDKAGRKKPFLAFVLAVMGLCCACLWFVAPGESYSIALGMALLITGYCCYTISELLHNSMLAGAGEPKSIPMISGLGLALGNAAGLLLLVVIFFLIQSGAFGLDEPTISRLTGPVTAIWLGIFVLFFFWLMPDVYRAGHTWGGALKGIATLNADEKRLSAGFWPVGFFMIKPFRSIIQKFREYPNVMKYLMARMIWSDALGAIFAMGAVYVSGFLGWSGAELTLYGILASIFAVSGGFVGGFLDQRLGPKLSLTVELIAIILIFILQLSITQESILYGLIPVGEPLHSGALFNSLADVTYMGLTMLAAVMIVACISSSRYMLVHIAPPENIGEFFGFYAMVGSVTLWLGPGLVDIVTTQTQSQRLGIASIGILFLIGLGLLQLVKAGKEPAYVAKSKTLTSD